MCVLLASVACALRSFPAPAGGTVPAMNARSHAACVSVLPALAFVLALALGACSHGPAPTATPPAPLPRESGKATKPADREPSGTDATLETADRDEPDAASDDATDADADAEGGQTGLASYYATKFEGRRTASGEVYRRDRMTAAHRSLPFGTRVRVTRLATGKSVELVVNDRGPFRKGRIVDLSRRAAEQLDLIRAGVARVRLEVLERPSD